MKNNYYLSNRTHSPIQNKNSANWRLHLTVLFSLFFILVGYAQKGKVGGGNKDIIPVVTCIKDLRNGLFQATFAYENPTNKEVTVDENGSIIKSNNGKRVAKGLNKFKPGSVDKVFTKEFGPGDFVEWTIISNGNTHTVIANVNSSKCAVDDGFIEPVLFNGKSTDIIGQELSSLCDSPTELVLSPLIFQIKEEKVLVEIVPINGKLDELITLLQAAPFTIPNEDFLLFDPTSTDNLNDQLSQYAVVDVYFIKEDLCLLNNYPVIVNFARPVYPARNNSTGILTQGDAAQKSNIVRDIYRTVDGDGGIVPVDGTGITIGVLSDSYDKVFGGPYAPLDIANGELPDDVILLKDNVSNATDEGRAMMQILHDVAPGATLQFHTATASPRQFEEGFNALAIDSDIIVDDITFITEPFFIGNGKIASAVQSFLDQPGKFHFTSAGNLANKAYQDTFTSSPAVPITNFIPLESPTRAHLFDGVGDYLQEISVVPGTYLIALQWKEDLASQNNSEGALDDLDIYIVDDLGRLLVGSNRVNIAGDPTEIIVFRATGSGNANILITSANGDPVDDFGNPKTLPFRYIAFYTGAEDGTPDGLKFEEYFGTTDKPGAPTVSGHAMIPNSITTGAVDYRRANAPVAETFSSYGGLLKDGTTLEIDLYAPDGGNTASTTIGQDAQCPTCDNDGVLNFYGTSAAAPHFAGTMALLMSAAPSWFPPTADQLLADPTLKTTYTAEEALDLFQTSAIPFTAANESAAGFLDTFAAFNSIAAPSAKITELRVEDGITPSTVPFTVKIIGEFFPDSPDDLEILFDDQPLEDVQIITEEDGSTVITAKVPTFSGNPELFVVTNGSTPGGTDGGPSNPLTFFDDGKLALNIVANNAEFEYGQDIRPTYYSANPDSPDYIPPYTVEGLPVDAEGEPVPFEALGLPPVVLNNSALDEKLAEDGYPIVFDYVITPSFGGQEYDQELFQINFIPGFIDPDEGKKGYLTITKKDLTITPHPLEEPANTPFTYTYGDAIDLTLNYFYDDTGISDNSLDFGFYSVIDATHQSDFKDGLPNKFRAVVSKFRAVVSDYDLLELLNGGSWSASDRTIENKFRAVVSGMNIIDLDNDDFTNYIDARSDFDDDVTNKFRAVVSKFRAVVSAEDLFSGAVDLSIDNKFRAVVSKFRAVVSTDDPERPYSGYESVFSIIDAEDAPPVEGEEGYPDDERAISDMYSLNMITGLEVTPEGENHYVYPGAFLNAMSANFNITYIPGSLIILPKALTASTDNLVIPYGTALTQDDLSTTFDGWAFENEFQESVETVFVDPDCVQEELAEGEICPFEIPYYFVKVGDAEETQLEIGDLNELGDYLIKIRNPKNYEITNIVDDDNELGTLTIEAATLTFNPLTITATYGETPVIDTENAISGFADGDTAAVLEGDDGRIPYYFVDASGNAFGLDDNLNASPVVDGIPVGYDIFITDDPNDNYVFIPDAKLGTLIIEPATLNFDLSTITATFGETPVIDTEDAEDAISGFTYGDTAAVLEGDDGRIPYYFVDASGNAFGLDDNLNASPVVDGIPVGYDIFITDDPNDNYVFIPDAKLGTLIILPAPLTFTSSDISITYGDDPPVIDPGFGPFAYDDNVSIVFPVGIPYYFVDSSGNEFGPDDNLNAGDYDIIITDDPSDNYDLIPDFTPEGDVKLGNLIVNKAVLYVRTGDLVIDEGATIDTSNIEPTITTITGDVYDETVQFSIEDEEGIAYTPGDTGVYFIKIVEPDNYRIEYTRLGTVYVNSNDVNRKIRTYTDCVELNPGDPNGLNYIAHFRYENPNDEAIYILAGSENQLTGPAALTAIGVLPIKFLPGEHTFEIRFDGTTLKWELISLDSNHKTSTTTNVNANSNQCDSNNTTNESGIPIYNLYPNPVDGDSTCIGCEYGILYIEQDISAMVTLDVFDLTGMLIESLSNTMLNGTIAPPTKHEIDMSGLEAGIYFIRLSTGNDVQVFSVVKD